MKRHHYPMSVISDVKKKLLELSMQENTPKKYSTQMFQACEIISQLQEELKGHERTEQESLDNEWVTDGTLPILEDSITQDKNRPEYMQFLCTIQIGDYPRQVRRLYFDQEKGWMQCGSDYNKYVVAWKSLPKPFVGDLAKELCDEIKETLVTRCRDIFVKPVNTEKELVAEVLSGLDGSSLSIAVTVRDKETRKETFSSTIPYGEADRRLFGLLQVALESE